MWFLFLGGVIGINLFVVLANFKRSERKVEYDVASTSTDRPAHPD